MSLICRIFGHAPLTNSGWAGGVGYATVNCAPKDALGTVHLYLEAVCPRCRKKYFICNVHVPKEFHETT